MSDLFRLSSGRELLYTEGPQCYAVAAAGNFSGFLRQTSQKVIWSSRRTEKRMDEDLRDLEVWMASPEAERLEFKEAKNSYEFDKLGKYCCALSNEGGGKIILGVTDKRPRRVVGSSAFSEPGRTAAGLVNHLRLRVTLQEIMHAGGRVLVFHVPPRPIGVPVQFDGIYWSRAGDELRPLPAQELRKIFDEAAPDFSAEIHPAAVVADLDPALIDRLRDMWSRKSGNTTIATLSHIQLLEDSELLIDGRLTNAALVLLGTRDGVGLRLAQAEVIFEYRNSEASLPFQQRKEFRSGFLGYVDEIWSTIDLRNEVLQYREGLFVGEIPVFNESIVREALLNALAHRDYRLGGSIFVRQFPRKLEIVSPGGFPPGITAENLLWRQSPRNRRIADVCAKCGLVERSGQGANLMFEESIRQGKERPSFAGTDEYQVSVTLRGEIQNPQFLGFLQKLGDERLRRFSTEDFLVLDSIQREESIPDALKHWLQRLIEDGVVERFGRGRGAKVILSRRLYAHLGKAGAYTRRKGLDRETNKELLLKHLRDNGQTGAVMKEFQQVLPALNRRQINGLLKELRAEGKVRSHGQRRWARWYVFEHKL